MKHEAQELLKSLDAGDNALLNDMIRSVSESMKTASEEESERHAVAFLMFVREFIPEALEGVEVGLPDSSLEKEDGDSYQTHLKNVMADNGHYYFGPISKHMYGIMGSGPGAMDVRGYGPRGKKNPKKSPTHSNAPAQADHGRGSGTRNTHEEVTGIVRMLGARDGDVEGEAKEQYDALSEQDKKDLAEIERHATEHNIELPTRKEMEGMSHEDLLVLAGKLDILGETRGGTLNVVDSDNEDGDGFKRRARDVSDFAPKAERGAGRNLKQSDNSGFKSALDTFRKNQKRRAEGKLDGDITDKDRRLGTISRHDTDTHKAPRPGMKHRVSAQEQADAEAAGVKPGMRGYGTKDPEGTAADQPNMSENKFKVQQAKQKLKNKAKLLETDKEHIDNLISGDVDVSAGKTKALTGTKVNEADLAAAGGNTGTATPDAAAGSEAPTESGPAWENLRESSDRIAADLLDPRVDGGTYSGDTLERATHKTGYYVSLAGAEKILPGEQVSRAQISAYLQNNKDAVQADNFGVWRYGGKAYLDVSRHFESKEEAEKFARENKQAAIWDIAGDEEIKVQGTPGAGASGLVRRVSQDSEAEALARGFEAHEREAAVSGKGAAGGKPKPDPQQHDLYSAEYFMMWQHGDPSPDPSAKPLTTPGMSKQEQEKILQAEADRITSTSWWKKTFPVTPKVTVNVGADNRGANAHRMTGELNVHEDTVYHTSGVLLHEMMHMVTANNKQAHGPEFARNHLEAVRALRGPEVADRLEANYKERGVKVADAMPRTYAPDKKSAPKLKTLMEERLAADLELANARLTFPKSPARIDQWTRRVDELDAQIANLRGTPAATGSAAKPSPDARGTKEQKLSLLASVIEDGIALRAKSNKIKADGGKPSSDLERQIMRNTRRQTRITDNLKDQHQASSEEIAEAKQAARAGTGKGALKEKLAGLYTDLDKVMGDENSTPEQKQAAIEQSLKDLKSEKNRIIGLLRDKHRLTERDIRNIREGVLGKPERKPKAAPTEPVEIGSTEEVATPDPKVKVKKGLADNLGSAYDKLVYGKESPTAADRNRVTGDKKSRATKAKKLQEVKGDHNQVKSKDLTGLSEETIAAASGKYSKNDARLGKGSVARLHEIANAPYLTEDQRLEAIAERISEGWETGLGINDPEGVSAVTGLSLEDAAGLLGSQREGVPVSEAKEWADKFFEASYYGEGNRPRGRSKAEWVSEAAQHYVEAVKSGDTSRANHPAGTPEEKEALNGLFDLSGDISPDEAMETIREGLKRLGYTDKDLEVTGSPDAPDEEVDDSGTFGGGAPAEDDDFGIPAAPASVTRDEAKQVLARSTAKSPAASVQKVLDKNKGTNLTGLPSSPVTVKGTGKLTFGSNKDLQKISEDYNKKNGISTPHPADYVEVKPEISARVAAEYEKMQHDPENPEVKAAYDALKKETLAQYKHAVENGYSFDFYPEGEDPYPNSPREAVIDLHKNKHMKVFPTLGPDGGFGSDNDEFPNHPLTEVIPGVEWSGKPVTYNDAFRAIHDVYGHGKEGLGFRASGEDNAYRQHAAMFSPEARRALTSETRGQNSFVNYGPKGEHNRTATADTEFAPQKAGLLPDWVADPELHSKGAPTEPASSGEPTESSGTKELDPASEEAATSFGLKNSAYLTDKVYATYREGEIAGVIRLLHQKASPARGPMRAKPERYLISSVEVDPKYRRQGVATELLTYARRDLGVPVSHTPTTTSDGDLWQRGLERKGVKDNALAESSQGEAAPAHHESRESSEAKYAPLTDKETASVKKTAAGYRQNGSVFSGTKNKRPYKTFEFTNGKGEKSTVWMEKNKDGAWRARLTDLSGKTLKGVKPITVQNANAKDARRVIEQALLVSAEFEKKRIRATLSNISDRLNGKDK